MLPYPRVLALLLLASTTTLGAAERAIPRLEKRGAITQLIVDGNPFVILGGELHNRSRSLPD